MKYGLKEDTINHIVKVILGNPKIEEIVLYGSRAKGTHREGSDIDLSLKGKDITVEDVNVILLELDELYLPYNIDLSVYEKIENHDLRNHIDRVGIALYSYQS